jgi:hypothetical protein
MNKADNIANEDYIQNPDEEGNTRRTFSNDTRYFSLLRIVGYRDSSNK